MTFAGILGPTHYVEYPRDAPTPVPDYASDLHLDQVLTAMLQLRPQFTLAHLFWQLPRTVEEVRWRQEVLQDLQRSEIRSCVEEFSASCAEMNRAWAQQAKSHNLHQQRAWQLHAALVYLRAVNSFRTQLQSANPRSSGLGQLFEWIKDYCASQAFADLERDAKQVLALLQDVRYVLRIKGLSVRVSRPADEANLEALIEETFSRFAHDTSLTKLETTRDTENSLLDQEPLSASTGLRVLSTDWELPPVQANSGWMSYVETRILDLVAQLFPEPFRALEKFSSRWPRFRDQVLMDFEREVQLYLAYLDLVTRLQDTGNHFCYPTFATNTRSLKAKESYDISLAWELGKNGQHPVPNSFHLENNECILLVTGPNHGGKTSFARAIGQLHHLGMLGFPVPGLKAEISFTDRIFTHFERKETNERFTGKLKEDLVRIHNALDSATSSSIMILNETFSSTSVADARYLASRVIHTMLQKRIRGAYVTFLDELVNISDQMVSMVALVDPHDPTKRTYRLERRSPMGMAYALVLAERYGLTRESIMKLPALLSDSLKPVSAKDPLQ